MANPAGDFTCSDPLLTQAQVSKMFRISRTQFWRIRTSSNFPPPIQISPRIIRWRLSDIENWLSKNPICLAVANADPKLTGRQLDRARKMPGACPGGVENSADMKTQLPVQLEMFI